MKRDYGTNGNNGTNGKTFRLFRLFRLFRNLSSDFILKGDRHEALNAQLDET
jgi:hypothetical protein